MIPETLATLATFRHFGRVIPLTPEPDRPEQALHGRVLLGPNGHRYQADQRLVADRLTSEIVATALRNIDRWESAGQLDSRWANEWRRLLERPLPEIQRALRSDSKIARELRQTSPFVGLVTEQERRRIIEAVEARR